MPVRFFFFFSYPVQLALWADATTWPDAVHRGSHFSFFYTPNNVFPVEIAACTLDFCSFSSLSFLTFDNRPFSHSAQHQVCQMMCVSSAHMQTMSKKLKRNTNRGHNRFAKFVVIFFKKTKLIASQLLTFDWLAQKLC